MAKEITGKKLATNVVFSITAQIISLLISFVLNLVVPKFISEYQYAYWQTFILYLSYTGIFHFGLLDGVVLRYSQFDYDELDKPRLRSQFRLLLCVTSIITVAMTAISLLACQNVTQIILILFAVAIVIDNQFTYCSFTFQLTNRIKFYVLMTLCYRFVHVTIVTILLCFRVNDFVWYCLSDLIGKVVSIFIFSFFNRQLYWGKSIKLKETLSECKLNIFAGLPIMISGFSASLLLGGAKMMIQWHWDELIFGKVSFAFSVSNIFLSFVTAASIVLFPSLKRMSNEKLPSLYKDIRNVISIFLLFVMIFYFPGCWILAKWLPKYSDSLVYLGILLPIIIYLSKVSLLTNNYLKAFRKEKALFIVNLSSAIVGILLFAFSAFMFDNLTSVLICVVAVVMLNSIVSEIVVSKLINIKLIKDIILEVCMTVGFILCTSLLSLWIGLSVYVGIFVVYCCFNYKSFVSIFRKIFKKKVQVLKEDNTNL